MIQLRISLTWFNCFFSASVMFAFDDFAVMKRVVGALPQVGIGVKYGLPQTRSARKSNQIYGILIQMIIQTFDHDENIDANEVFPLGYFNAIVGLLH